MKKILVFGTFDILHPGHEYFLIQAKEQAGFSDAGYLIVVVARDLTVKQIKKEFPVNNETERLKTIQTLGYVDKAVLGSTDNDKYKIIEEIKPDIICLGYDQTAFVDELPAELKKKGLNPEIVRIGAYKAEEHKSSHYKKKNI
ncbi:FAD synthase [Candidatus Woesearchaeota archaeon]|nr:FAD synthase [Candidatus Woesearchaeota archaeon]